MWRKLSIITVLLLISMGILLWPESKAVQTDSITTSSDPLIMLYRESEAEFKKLQIEGWVLINNNFESFDNLNKIINTIDGETDISLARLKRTTFGEKEKENEEIYSRGIHLEGKDQGYHIVVDVQSTRSVHEEGPEPETYAIVTLEKEVLDLKYTKVYRQVQEALELLAPNSQTSTVITARTKEQMNGSQRETKLDEMLAVAEAKKISSITADNLTSVTAHTSLINEGVEISGEKVNLNLASRNNYLEETTYFYIGTPIISIEH